VRTDVGNPNVVIGIHSQAVGGLKQAIAERANKPTTAVEFDERLRAAMEYQNVPFRIQRDAGDFAEIHPGGDREEVLHGFISQVWQFGLLRKDIGTSE
jgi:hypothetical protein